MIHTIQKTEDMKRTSKPPEERKEKRSEDFLELIGATNHDNHLLVAQY
jgi:hypothetical protein